MSSVIFQPLLHDPLGWKASNTTYADTYTWKNYRTSNKDKRISAYGQQYQRQLQKQQKLQQTNASLPTVTTNEEQTNLRLVSGKKNEESRGTTPASQRATPPVVTEKSPILIVEHKQRSASVNRVRLFIFLTLHNRMILLFRNQTVLLEHPSVHQLLQKVR